MFYDTTLPDPRAAIPSVINVSHAEETYYYRGRTFTRWRIDFDRPTLESYPFWDYAEVWVKIGEEGEWAFATKSQGDYVLDPVEEGETYYVNIVGVSIFGGKQAFGEGFQVSATIQGMSGLPSDVAWMTAVAHGDSVSIYAPELNEPDVFGYEVRMGAAFDGGIVVGFNETPNFRLSGVAPGTKTFWMKAKNNAGFYSENAVSAQVVVFYPSGYTAKNSWTWDYSTGTHDNTEQYTYSAVGSLRCAHTGGVLEGTWTSPQYDLGSKKDVRIWGDFITGIQSTDVLWKSVFGEGDLWGDRISAGQKWYQVFAPSTTGHLKATLHYGDTTGNLTNSIDRFEMFSPEVSARYIQVKITITDPALDVYTYVNKLNMTAAFWRDTP
jgi:hypothetical protein